MYQTVFLAQPAAYATAEARAALAAALDATCYSVQDELGEATGWLRRYLDGKQPESDLARLRNECVLRRVSRARLLGQRLLVVDFPTDEQGAAFAASACGGEVPYVVLARTEADAARIAPHAPLVAACPAGTLEAATEAAAHAQAQWIQAIVRAANAESALVRPPTTQEPASALETAVTIAALTRACKLATAKPWFPGTHPVSLERKHLPSLSAARYSVSRKAHGVRHLLYVRDGRAWLLRRNMRAWKTAWSAPLLEWDNSVVDVELIAQSNHCLVLDALVAQGKKVTQRPLMQRLRAVDALVGECLPALFAGGASAQTYFSFTDLRCACMLPQPHPTDGLVFTPLTEPYTHARDHALLKWKPPSENTVDLLYRQERVHAANREGTRLLDYGSLCDYPDWLQDGTLVECVAVYLAPGAEQSDGTWPAAARNQWRALRQRTDKSMPNPEWVCRRICRSIADNVTFAELADLPGVR